MNLDFQNLREQWTRTLWNFSNTPTITFTTAELSQLRSDCNDKVIELSNKIINALPGSDQMWAEDEKSVRCQSCLLKTH